MIGAGLNRALLSGMLELEPFLSHAAHNERFYQTVLQCARKSGVIDQIPIVISESVLLRDGIGCGCGWFVEGQVRSVMLRDEADDSARLMVAVYAKRCWPADEGTVSTNQITLCGKLWRDPVYRTTPLQREICDMMLCVPRTHGRHDRIPCITWGACARYAGQLEQGDMISVEGRMQSRTYTKKLPDGAELSRMVYEVSVAKFSRLGSLAGGVDE